MAQLAAMDLIINMKVLQGKIWLNANSTMVTIYAMFSYREWRERITAWFVDLENGGSGEKPKRRPPPRRFQSRLIGDSDMNNRGLATLPEVETNPEDQQVQQPPTSQQPVPSVSKPATDTSSTLAKGSAAPTSATVSSSTYQRVYPDRRPSLKVNTDVVSAMEAIEGMLNSPNFFGYLFLIYKACYIIFFLCRSSKSNKRKDTLENKFNNKQ